MSAPDLPLSAEALADFREHGWLRLTGAFSPAAAGQMRDAAWNLLAQRGILRSDPATWTEERPANLQALRRLPAFAEIGTERLREAIAALLGRPFPVPPDWGSLFLAFPGSAPWSVPESGWHIDCNYLSAIDPPGGIKTFALLADTPPQSGATLFASGSHRAVHAFLRENPPPPGSRSADIRRHLLSHPWFAALHAKGEAEARANRFLGPPEEHGGISLQVQEMTGHAGDIYLLHPLVLHVAAANAGDAPRFLLSGGVTLDGWGWGEAR